jgi:hypothetical protein
LSSNTLKIAQNANIYNKCKDLKFRVKPFFALFFVFFCSFVCWWDLGLNTGLHTCKTGTLLIEPHLQVFLLWLFWRWGLENYLSRLASWSQPPKKLGLQMWATSSWLTVKCWQMCDIHLTNIQVMTQNISITSECLLMALSRKTYRGSHCSDFCHIGFSHIT